MKVHQNDLDRGLTKEEINNYTHEFLDKYGWKLRNQNEQQIISQSEREKVDKQMNKCFTKDFKFTGATPYISFCNLLGIKDKLLNDDEDAVISIVAPPGKGKSSLACTFARFIDPNFTVERVIFSNEEFEEFLEYATAVLKDMKEQRQKGKKPKNPLSGTAVVLDEGVYMIFSGDAQTKEGKKSQKLFSIIRALNLIVIVNITNFKKINKGVVDDRLYCMWRIQKRGYINFLSKKKVEKIRLKNRDLIYPSPNFNEEVGFISKSCKFWKDYEVKKADFLERSVNDENE